MRCEYCGISSRLPQSIILGHLLFMLCVNDMLRNMKLKR